MRLPHRQATVQDEVLTRAEVADISLQTSAKSADLVFFVNTFPALMPAGSTHDSLLEAFAEYQCSIIDDCVRDRMDLSWKALSDKKNGGGVKPFQALASVMLGILTIPHSSAHCERVFSCVRQNKTDTRNALGDDTLESLLVLKSNPVSCIDLEYSAATMRSLKSAYHRSLNTDK